MRAFLLVALDWLHRGPSARARRDAELKGRIVAIWIESGGIYSCPQIHAVLLAEGERVGRKRVARLMQELGIEGVTRRRFKTGTTERDGSAEAAPDLVNRKFSAEGPDQLWVADITYVRTWDGWLYLAVVLGDALTMAIARRQPKGAVIHHSDRRRLLASIATPFRRCCDDRLNLGSTGRWPSGSGAGRPALVQSMAPRFLEAGHPGELRTAAW